MINAKHIVSENDQLFDLFTNIRPYRQLANGLLPLLANILNPKRQEAIMLRLPYVEVLLQAQKKGNYWVSPAV